MTGRTIRRGVIAFVLAFATCSGVMAWWATLEHRPRSALMAVDDYTSRSINVVEEGGATVDPARLASCRRDPTFEPFQTNGNRIRRWVRGQKVSPDSLRIDYPDCLVRFYLRQSDDGTWQVYSVRSHAG